MSSTPADPFGGVKCFSIGGRMVERRQRCLGMTEEERRWRAQWLKDQVLLPDEPRFVPEYYKDTNSFLRRIYKSPLLWLQRAATAKMGPDMGFLVRQMVGKLGMAIGATYMIYYYVKYHSNDFSVAKTLEIYQTRGRMFPCDPDYPNFPEKEPHEYYDHCFYSSVLCQKVEPPPPPPPPPPKSVGALPIEVECVPEDQVKE